MSGVHVGATRADLNSPLAPTERTAATSRPATTYRYPLVGWRMWLAALVVTVLPATDAVSGGFVRIGIGFGS
jgi:hypothetical protein